MKRFVGSWIPCGRSKHGPSSVAPPLRKCKDRFSAAKIFSDGIPQSSSSREKNWQRPPPNWSPRSISFSEPNETDDETFDEIPFLSRYSSHRRRPYNSLHVSRGQTRGNHRGSQERREAADLRASGGRRSHADYPALQREISFHRRCAISNHQRTPLHSNRNRSARQQPPCRRDRYKRISNVPARQTRPNGQI